MSRSYPGEIVQSTVAKSDLKKGRNFGLIPLYLEKSTISTVYGIKPHFFGLAVRALHITPSQLSTLPGTEECPTNIF